MMSCMIISSPPDIRDTPRYKKYTLSVMTGYFYEHFRLIEDVV